MAEINMEFEWDDAKSAINATKHGIDFPAATALWSDERRLTLPSRQPGEPREMVIGCIAGVCWTAIATQRNRCVRIISVRRSRDNEQTLYQQSP